MYNKRLKKFAGFTALAIASTTAALASFGVGIYFFETQKEFAGIASGLAGFAFGISALKFQERAAHHRRVYNAQKRYEKEDNFTPTVGVEKTLASEERKQKQIIFFSSKKELKEYRKEKHRREKEEAKQNERTK